MPASDTEPDNYSIDDMMDRLRSRSEGGQEDAQLVTREDGTQVYRVKKRKRRSHQPKKEKEQRQKRFRVVQVVAAVGLVVLVAVAFFASLVYLNSSAYRESIIGKIRIWTGAEPKVTQLRVTPVGASADSLELVWPEESMLATLKLNSIQGGLSFTKLVGGTWKGAEMYSNQGGTLVLRQPTGKTVASPKPTGDLPFQFHYRSSKFNVRMGEEKSPVFAVRGSEASLELHDTSADTSNLRLEGGTLNVAGWGDFNLEFASLQFEPRGMRIGNIRLIPAGAQKGEIEIFNPDKLPFEIGGDDAKLPVKVSHITLNDLLGPSFGSWLSTTVETPEDAEAGELRVSTSDNRGISWRIPFRAMATAETVMTGFPMLEVMAREMQETWYEQPHFDIEAKGVAVRNETSSGIEGLILDARGRLSISGKVTTNAEGRLEGELQVGLPTSAVASGSPALRQVFNRKGGGFSWAKVRVSGTPRQPADDLEAQLKSSTTTTAPAAGGDKALEDAFEDLVTPERR